MKPSFILFAFVLFFTAARAQSDSSTCVQEINQQVWKPFIAHFTSGDKAGFRNLHSKRITRVQIDNNVIQDYEKYFPAEKENGKPSKNFSRLFELRFDKRICKGAKAWETGYYKGTVIETGKAPRSYFGRFFVVLEKEDSGWKIVVDADTGKGATEENFNSARPLE